ncbi:MAG: PDZ domain-containing protein [Steroidobacteraceae bacterium]
MTRGALFGLLIAAALLLSAVIASMSGMLYDVETSPPASATGATDAASVLDNSSEGVAVPTSGLTIRALTSEDQRQSNMKVGLMVERAKDPAAAAGVQRGDIVVAANGVALSNVDDFRNVLLRSKGHIALLVQRGASRIFVPVRIG